MTITHLVIILPDWHSLESVRHAHSDLEATALVFFALLVLFEALAHLSDSTGTKTILDRIGIVFFAVAVLAEIVAYPYGQRNDTLSEQMIGSLSDEAGRADEKAKKALTDSGTALTNAGDAETKAGAANIASGQAKDEAETARVKADAVGTEADDLLHKYVTAESKLDKEEKTRLALEKDLQPRVLSYVVSGGKENIAPLRTFVGMHVIFEAIDDREPQRAAGSVQWILKEAGWISDGLAPTRKFVENGVVIEYAFGDLKGQCAALTLTDFLQSSNWVVTRNFFAPELGHLSPGEPGEPLAPNTLRVLVGLKPDPYFNQPSPEIQSKIDDAKKWATDLLRERCQPFAPKQ